VSKEADEALSLFFEKPVRLIRKGSTQRWPGLDPSKEPKGRNWRPADGPVGPSEWSLNSAFTRWQDFYPLLVASSASLEHIQKTLVKSIYPDSPPQSEEEDEEHQDGKTQPGVYGETDGRKVHSYKPPGKLDKKDWGGECDETVTRNFNPFPFERFCLLSSLSLYNS